jgi:hypothetical protein
MHPPDCLLLSPPSVHMAFVLPLLQNKLADISSGHDVVTCAQLVQIPGREAAARQMLCRVCWAL